MAFGKLIALVFVLLAAFFAVADQASAYYYSTYSAPYLGAYSYYPSYWGGYYPYYGYGPHFGHADGLSPYELDRVLTHVEQSNFIGFHTEQIRLTYDLVGQNANRYEDFWPDY